MHGRQQRERRTLTLCRSSCVPGSSSLAVPRRLTRGSRGRVTVSLQHRGMPHSPATALLCRCTRSAPLAGLHEALADVGALLLQHVDGAVERVEGLRGKDPPRPPAKDGRHSSTTHTPHTPFHSQPRSPSPGRPACRRLRSPLLLCRRRRCLCSLQPPARPHLLAPRAPPSSPRAAHHSPPPHGIERRSVRDQSSTSLSVARAPVGAPLPGLLLLPLRRSGRQVRLPSRDVVLQHLTETNAQSQPGHTHLDIPYTLGRQPHACASAQDDFRDNSIECVSDCVSTDHSRLCSRDHRKDECRSSSRGHTKITAEIQRSLQIYPGDLNSN